MFRSCVLKHKSEKDIRYKKQHPPLVLGAGGMWLSTLTAVCNCGVDKKCLEAGFRSDCALTCIIQCFRNLAGLTCRLFIKLLNER